MTAWGGRDTLVDAYQRELVNNEVIPHMHVITYCNYDFLKEYGLV